MADINRNLTYEDVARGIVGFTTEEQLNLLEFISSHLRKKVVERQNMQHSIMELEGLGAEIWKGVDAQEYVQKERESWD